MAKASSTLVVAKSNLFKRRPALFARWLPGCGCSFGGLALGSYEPVRLAVSFHPLLRPERRPIPGRSARVPHPPLPAFPENSSALHRGARVTPLDRRLPRALLSTHREIRSTQKLPRAVRGGPAAWWCLLF